MCTYMHAHIHTQNMSVNRYYEMGERIPSGEKQENIMGERQPIISFHAESKHTHTYDMNAERGL